MDPLSRKRSVASPSPENTPTARQAGRVVCLAIALAAAISAGCASSGVDTLEGAAMPLHIREWIQGGPFDVTDGEHLYVLEFWLTTCPHCRSTIPELTDLQRTYGDSGVIVIALSNESPAVLQAFMALEGDRMEYAVAADNRSATFNDYGVATVPRTFLIDRDGKFAWGGGAPDERLRAKIESLIGAD